MRLVVLALVLAACADHMSAEQIQTTCAQHPMPRYVACPAPTGECSAMYAQHTCEELLAACDVSLDEYLACTSPTCGSSSPPQCRAFAACGIQAWSYMPPVSSCG